MLSPVVLCPVILPFSKLHWSLPPAKVDQFSQTVRVESPKPKWMIAKITAASATAHNPAIEMFRHMAGFGNLAGAAARPAGAAAIRGGGGTRMDCWHAGQLIFIP